MVASTEDIIADVLAPVLIKWMPNRGSVVAVKMFFFFVIPGINPSLQSELLPRPAEFQPSV